jgi:hypothetical protein
MLSDAQLSPTFVLLHCNIILQELLHYVPWPSDVLEDYAPVAAEALGGSPAAAAAAAGGSRGRGPVLRMGLAEGTPHSILPDHLVRIVLCLTVSARGCVMWGNVINGGRMRLQGQGHSPSCLTTW